MATNNATPEQLEHRRRQKVYAEKKQQKKSRAALCFTIGEIVLARWPWAKDFQVRGTKAENELEFAPLQERLRQISRDPNYSTPPSPKASDNDEHSSSL
jgi:hypothetical protein